MAYLITKASGNQEEFNVDKFKKSLRRSGAPENIIELITAKIQELQPKTTHEIYQLAFEYLKKTNRPIAARYNLKKALFEFGPAGFPFEKFISHIFEKLGYQVEVDKILSGACVEHEVDVFLHKTSITEMVECKFHNRPGLISDVKIPLYVKARYDDLEKGAHQNGWPKIAHAWVVTNTRFTSQAIQYAQCVDLKLLDWSYPLDNSLAQLIDRYGLHPITALPSLSNRQKELLMNNGVVLCSNLSEYRSFLQEIGLRADEIEQLISESQAVCKI